MRDDRPYAVYTILALNVAVFGLQSMSGGSTDGETLYRMGALSRRYIWAGEYWRLVTPLFLHIGPLHLFVNCASLYQLGPSLEHWAGTYRFLGIYFLSAIGGSVACLLGHDIGSAGASGGVFGLLGGVLAVLYFQYYRDWGAVLRSPVGSQVAFWTGANFLYGLSAGGICNWAHFGGWVTGGMACAYFASDFLRRREREARVRRLAIAMVAALVLGAAYAAYPFRDPEFHAWRGDRAFARERWGDALGEYEAAFRLGANSPTLVYRLAWVSHQLGRTEEALRYVESYTAVAPADASGWAFLSALRRASGDEPGARAAQEKAAAIHEAESD